MEKQLSKEQVSIISYFLIRSCFMGLAMEMLVQIAKQDSIFGLFLGALLGIIPFLLYQYLMNYNPNFSIMELNIHAFGKKIGKIINLLLIIFVFFLGTIVFWNLIIFISSQYLYQTPTLFIAIMFIIPIFYLLIRRLKGIARVSMILIIFSLILYFISIFGLMGQVHWYNFRPLFTTPVSSILNASFHYFAYCTLILFLITIIPKKQIAQRDKKNWKTSWKIGYFLIHLFTFSALFFTIAVFGIKMTLIYQYPEFHILKRVSIVGVLERIESTLAFRWIFDFFISITFCLYFVTEGIKRTFQIQKDKLLIFIQILVCIMITYFSTTIFANNTEGFYFLTNYFPLLLVFFFLVIPSITYLRLITMRKKMQKTFSTK